MVTTSDKAYIIMTKMEIVICVLLFLAFPPQIHCAVFKMHLVQSQNADNTDNQFQPVEIVRLADISY